VHNNKPSVAILAALFLSLVIAACSRAPDPTGATGGTPSAPAAAAASAAGASVEWREYGGNIAAQRYSPLAQINRDNVGRLEIAWTFQTGNYGPRPEMRNETTPLMIDGVLYTTVGVTRNVVAIDPKTGETLWVWRANDGEQRFAAAPRKTSGRGLSYWKDGAGNQRLLVVTPGFYLVSLDPDTGRQTPGFASQTSAAK